MQQHKALFYLLIQYYYFSYIDFPLLLSLFEPSQLFLSSSFQLSSVVFLLAFYVM